MIEIIKFCLIMIEIFLKEKISEKYHFLFYFNFFKIFVHFQFLKNFVINYIKKNSFFKKTF